MTERDSYHIAPITMPGNKVDGPVLMTDAQGNEFINGELCDRDLGLLLDEDIAEARRLVDELETVMARIRERYPAPLKHKVVGVSARVSYCEVCNIDSARLPEFCSGKDER